MKHMLDELLQRVRTRHRDEGGSALMLAIMVIIIVFGIVAAFTLAIISGTQKSAQTRDYTYHSLAADAALNDALSLANSEIAANNITAVDQFVGVANARTGSLTLPDDVGGEVKWRWYATPTPSTIPHTDYTIHATGYKGEDAEAPSAFHYSARLRSFAYDEALVDEINGKPKYVLPPQALYDQGTVGLGGVDVSDKASFFSYNSQVGVPTGGTANTARSDLVVAGEGELIFRNYSGFARNGIIYNLGEDESRADRCGGEGCLIPTLGHRHNIAPSWSFTQDNMKAISGNDGLASNLCSSYSNYVSSAQGNVLSPSSFTDNFMCINNLTIDQDTTIDPRFSTGSPLYLFVKGNVTIEPGKTLNSASGTNNRGPIALRIYTNGNVNVKGHAATPTSLNGVVHAMNPEEGVCTIGESGQKAKVHGAIACDKFYAAGDAEVWHDLQTHQLSTMNTIKQAWSLSNYDISSGVGG